MTGITADMPAGMLTKRRGSGRQMNPKQEHSADICGRQARRKANLPNIPITGFSWIKASERLARQHPFAMKTGCLRREGHCITINDLPLSLIISWFEQKAVAILLTLLYLGIQDIRLGPSLPAFVSPNVLNVLVEKFAIKPTGTAQEDLAAILN